MTKYQFVVNNDRTECLIYTLRPAGKYIGKVIKAADGRSIQEFAPDVCWLPVSRALAAIGEMSHEKAVLQELGY